jgi:hypothetical protein
MSTITTEVGRAIFKMFARSDRDDALVPADQADLIVVMLFVAVGILLTSVFFMFGYWVEFGRILAAAS